MATALRRGGPLRTAAFSLIVVLMFLTHIAEARDVHNNGLRSLLSATNGSDSARAKALIIGGAPASINRFPYIVGVFQSIWGGRGCGGTLLTPRVVLTAAHCAADSDPNAYYILNGFKAYYNSWDDVGTGAKWRRRAIQVVRHPGWSERSWACLGAGTARHDLALILLDKPVTTPTIRLPAATAAKPTSGNLLVIGYGQNNTEADDGSYTVSATLKRLSVPVVSPATCSSEYGCDARNPASITRSVGMLCAGGQAANSAGCKGDSGSPLIRTNSKSPNNYKTDVLNGVFSYMGTPCGRPQAAGGYTWVPYYRSWIDKQIAAWNEAISEINKAPQ